MADAAPVPPPSYDASTAQHQAPEPPPGYPVWQPYPLEYVAGKPGFVYVQPGTGTSKSNTCMPGFLCLVCKNMHFA